MIYVKVLFFFLFFSNSIICSAQQDSIISQEDISLLPKSLIDCADKGRPILQSTKRLFLNQFEFIEQNKHPIAVIKNKKIHSISSYSLLSKILIDSITIDNYCIKESIDKSSTELLLVITKMETINHVNINVSDGILIPASFFPWDKYIKLRKEKKLYTKVSYCDFKILIKHSKKEKKYHFKLFVKKKKVATYSLYKDNLVAS